MAKAPVWFAGNETLVKVPKFSHTFITLLVGDQGTDVPSALMAESSSGGGAVVKLGGLAWLRRKTAFHFLNREKVCNNSSFYHFLFANDRLR